MLHADLLKHDMFFLLQPLIFLFNGWSKIASGLLNLQTSAFAIILTANGTFSFPEKKNNMILYLSGFLGLEGCTCMYTLPWKRIPIEIVASLTLPNVPVPWRCSRKRSEQKGQNKSAEDRIQPNVCLKLKPLQPICEKLREMHMWMNFYLSLSNTWLSLKNFLYRTTWVSSVSSPHCADHLFISPALALWHPINADS